MTWTAALPPTHNAALARAASVRPAACARTRNHVAGATGLANALAGEVRVRSVSDPHIARWLAPLADLDAAPTLFPDVDRRCTSFSQWWTRATRGLHDARELM